MPVFFTLWITQMTEAAAARGRAGWAGAIMVPATFAVALAVIPLGGKAQAQGLPYEPGDEARAFGFECIGIVDEGYFRRQERCKQMEEEYLASVRLKRFHEQRQQPARPAVIQVPRKGSPIPRTGSAPRSAIGSGGIANSGVNFGASIDTVLRSLSGRPAEKVPAYHHGNLHRLVVNARFPEIDPRVIRLSYEFDAPEGPSAKLIGVTLTYARDNSSRSQVYSERVSTLSKRYPLALQSAGQMEAIVSDTVISVFDDPMRGAVDEVYRKR